MKYSLFKIKPNKVDQWRDWCNLLNGTHRKEAIKTLEDEGLLFEFFIIFPVAEEWYTIGAGIEKPGHTIRTADMDIELNREHKRNKQECLEYVERGEAAYFLDNLTPIHNS